MLGLSIAAIAVGFALIILGANQINSRQGGSEALAFGVILLFFGAVGTYMNLSGT